MNTLGGLDIAFNNAGTLGAMAPIADMEVADFDAVIGTNLHGIWLMERAEIRAMLVANTKGSIFNTSSFVARAAGAGTSAYASSKAGVDAMTVALALGFASTTLRRASSKHRCSTDRV